MRFRSTGSRASVNEDNEPDKEKLSGSWLPLTGAVKVRDIYAASQRPGSWQRTAPRPS